MKLVGKNLSPPQLTKVTFAIVLSIIALHVVARHTTSPGAPGLSPRGQLWNMGGDSCLKGGWRWGGCDPGFQAERNSEKGMRSVDPIPGGGSELLVGS